MRRRLLAPLCATSLLGLAVYLTVQLLAPAAWAAPTPAPAPAPAPAAAPAPAPAPRQPSPAPAPAPKNPTVPAPAPPAPPAPAAAPTPPTATPMPPPGQPNGGGQAPGPGDPSTPNSPDEDPAAHGGVMTGLFGPVEGVPRLDHYDLGYDSGAWNNIPRKFWGLLTQLAWTFVLWLVQIALWMLSWGLTFGFASFLTDPANSVAHSWQDLVGSQLGLTVFVLTITAAWAGIRLMRGQSQRGLAEFATSLLVLGVTASVLATPGTTLLGPDGLMGQAKNVSLAFAGAAFDPAHGADTGMGSKDLIANMSKGVVSAFVVRPHQILDWGSTLDRPGKEKCLAAYTKLIEKGPWGSQDDPRDRMNDAGCTSEADFNHDPGPDRMVGAVLVAIAALFVMVLMILIAVGLAAAQVGLAFLAIVAPLALLAGLLPGSARQPLWAWFVGVLKALTAVMASIMFLGVFLLLVNASLASSEGKPLLARLAVLDILVLFGIGLRKRLVAAAQSVASGITSKVASSSAGGPPIGGFWGTGAAIGGSGGSAGAAGVEGGDVAGLWRDTRGEIGRLPRMYRDIRLGLAARRPRAGTGLRPARDLDTGPRRRRDPSDLAEDVGADGRRDRLVAELGRSKTGRGVLGATRAGAAGTKFGWAATLGLPVSVPRASRAGREAARRSGQSLRDELVRQKAAGAAYWKEWGDGVAGGARLAYRGTGARAAVTRMRRSPTPEPAGVAPSGTGAPLRQGRNRPPTSLQHRIRPPAGRSAVEPISGHGGARTAVPPRGSGRRGTSVLTPPRAAGTHAAPASTVRTAVPPDGPGLSPGQELPPLPPPAEILRNLQARLGR